MNRSRGKTKYLFSTSHQQEMSSYFLASINGSSKRQNLITNAFIPFSLAFIAEQMPHVMEYPFSHLGSAVLAVSLPRTGPSSAEVRGHCWRHSLGAVPEPLSTTQNTQVLLAPFQHHHSTRGAAMRKSNSRPAWAHATLNPVPSYRLISQTECNWNTVGKTGSNFNALKHRNVA